MSVNVAVRTAEAEEGEGLRVWEVEAVGLPEGRVGVGYAERVRVRVKVESVRLTTVAV